MSEKDPIGDFGTAENGFGLLFEEQVYPWGYNALLTEVRDRLGLKV